MTNQFGKISRFELKASCSKSGRTFISDSFFTSPFKIMKPFQNQDGSISLYQQTSSPGIFAGDIQEYHIIIEENAKLEIMSQSFEKIFKMEENELGERKIRLQLQKNSSLFFSPLPCIPFSESRFRSESKVFLADKSSRFLYEDILCGGRISHGELFDFDLYQNLIEVRRGKKLIFRDNAFFEGSKGGKNPERKGFLQSPSVFGGFTHAGSLLLFGFEKNQWEIRKVLGLEEKLLYAQKAESESERLVCEVTETDSGDIALRALAYSAEEIQKSFERVKAFIR